MAASGLVSGAISERVLPATYAWARIATETCQWMQTLTINAVTLESAEGFIAGLAGFDASLVETTDGGYLVEISLGHGDREIVAVLNALADHVKHREQRPVEVDLAGRTYELHPSAAPV